MVREIAAGMFLTIFVLWVVFMLVWWAHGFPECRAGYVATFDWTTGWACVPGYRPSLQ